MCGGGSQAVSCSCVSGAGCWFGGLHNLKSDVVVVFYGKYEKYSSCKNMLLSYYPRFPGFRFGFRHIPAVSSCIRTQYTEQEYVFA